MLFESMHPSWQAALADQRSRLDAIEHELELLASNGEAIAPQMSRVMRALATDLSDVRVLIVGQDPYPTDGHACGLAFAVETGVSPLPRSLQNIMRELGDDLPAVTHNGEIFRWQHQGVLLLNRHLTTRVGAAGSHTSLGWAELTDAVIRVLNARDGGFVAVLWGAQAQQLAPALTNAVVISSAHPSPLSAYRGFFGSKPFSRVNAALNGLGLPEIDWSC